MSLNKRNRIKRLHWRAAFFRLIRRFFEEYDFLEVDTPVRQPVLIPEANIYPIRSEGAFLQTSPELCMKRLLALGDNDSNGTNIDTKSIVKNNNCERIFQICPCFRKEERGRLHSEEFTILEWYRRDSDYQQLMNDCHALIGYLAIHFAEYIKIDKGSIFGGLDIFAKKWDKVTVSTAFTRYVPESAQITLEEALKKKHFDDILVEHIEPHLGMEKPTFLYDYPIELASLARRKKDSPRYAERFELYMSGIEIANGFSELADVSEQKKRFEQECTQIVYDRNERINMPDKFLETLPQMGNAAGIALGVDRLLMLACNASSIEDVQSFNWHEL